MKKVKMILLADFNSIFPNEEQLSPDVYLRGINKPLLLKIACFMLGLKESGSKFYKLETLLEMWFRRENISFAKEIYKNCKLLEEDNNAVVSLISPLASLYFFEYIFAMPEYEETQDEAISEINLFKAYIIFLTNSTKRENVSKEYLENYNEKLKISATLLNQAFPMSDLANYDLGEIFFAQVIKAFLLFQFLESKKEIEYLLKAFYEYFNFIHWKEYLQFMMPLVQGRINHPNEGWTHLTIPKGENFKRICKFLESISLEIIDSEIDYDFRLLRGRPLYKVEEGVYSIISPLFVFEKIFKGLFFKLNEIHNKIPNEKKSIKNLKSFYTTNFSENFLLYKILDHIYGNRSYIKFSGLEISNENIDGGPDYYIRNGNYIFLFENKDVLINAEIKQSSNFELIEDELKKKFYFDKKGNKVTPKAVIQIVQNIRKILKKENVYDVNYNLNSIQIYPLLVLHDTSFNCPGLNAIIDYWFKLELYKLQDEGLNISRVKSLTVINIDTLILYADFFRTKKKTLNDLIEAYIKNSIFDKKKIRKDLDDVSQAYMNTQMSFSYFVNKYTNWGYKKNENELLNKVYHSIL
jgi:hypothetical protein